MREELLGNVVRIRTGKLNANASDENGAYPFFTCAKGISKINTYAFDCECVLVAGNGELNVKYYDGKFNAYQRTYIIEVINQSEISTKFLFYFLDKYVERLRNSSIGGVIKYIKINHLTDIILPLPEIEIQNKIVAVLDMASALVNKREETIQLSDELLRATFLDMFQKDLILFRNSEKKLSDIASIVSGFTKGRKTKDTNLIEFPYLRVANTQDGYFNLNQIKTITATKKEIEQYTIVKGDLLITEGGDPDKLGRGAVWENEDNMYIYQNHLFRLRINNLNEYSPQWLIQLIGSEFGKYYFLRQAKQTTGIATINKRQVSNFPIPIASFIKQKEFEQHYLRIKKNNRILIDSLVDFKTLVNSIIQRVFNGQLNFNIDFELDALISEIDLMKKENNLSKIAGDIAYLQRLVDKLNAQEFIEKSLYDKAKHATFQLMTVKEEDKKISQKYNEKTKNIELIIE